MFFDQVVDLPGVKHLRAILGVLARADVLGVVEACGLHAVSRRHGVLSVPDGEVLDVLLINLVPVEVLSSSTPQDK